MPRRIINASSSKTNQSAPNRSVNSQNSPRRQRATIVSGVKGASQPEPLQADSESEKGSRRSSSQSRPINPVTAVFFGILRLIILGVGLSAIAGTALTVFDPTGLLAAYLKTPPLSSAKKESAKTEEKVPTPSSTATAIAVGQELTDLKAKLDKIATQSKYAKLKPQAWFMDLDNGAYVSVNGSVPVPAASTIKIPVLVAFFEALDAGKIHLDEILIMDKAIITSGAGNMQYKPPGTKFTALETATQMIVISDNTATDMLIRRLGGKEALNARFRDWGMTNTVINNRLPDLEGTNTTTPEDLSKLLARIERGEVLTLRSRDRLLGIMQETRTRTLLPQGLEKDAIISHKTGDIGSIIGDAGIIDIPNGKRYIGAVFTSRPYNDPMGRALIQDFSRTTYQHFKWYQVRPKVNPPEPAKPPQKTTSNN
ncbi:beta-lactamase [Rippkaea orientalis PCC 8801]|uniref:Beta-lactamase n=1 Tax=Rippkaea orientalis (strain PCC 8801 / RF-1) TaxID=41431 RepID=B7JVX1_RIPO1|nr:serine hydrolase [Rippkaea orientalis]ACK65660.1 beta-lactamase [Rippkaea orientalis PCC 8801]